jgi:flagellin
MGLKITTNVAAIKASNSLDKSQASMEKASAQLASGSRITKAADDAAGLSISENLKSSIRGNQQARRNASDGVSMIQVSEGALGEVSNILTRFKELSVQASSDNIGDKERTFIDKEVQQLKKEIDRIAMSTKYGDKHLLDGSAGMLSFQVGTSNDPANQIEFETSNQDARTDSLGVDGIDLTSKGGARDALDVIETAQQTVNGHRANLGAMQNRLISTQDNLSSAIENFSAANSRIRDTDVAQSAADFSRNQILMNASLSAMSQANAMPSQALRLLN